MTYGQFQLSAQKNSLPHRASLSALALELLSDTRELAGESLWVFPAARGKGHLSGMAVDHAVLRSRKMLQHADLTPTTCDPLQRPI